MVIEFTVFVGELGKTSLHYRCCMFTISIAVPFFLLIGLYNCA
jgi:hypothetical protein